VCDVLPLRPAKEPRSRDNSSSPSQLDPPRLGKCILAQIFCGKGDTRAKAAESSCPSQPKREVGKRGKRYLKRQQLLELGEPAIRIPRPPWPRDAQPTWSPPGRRTSADARLPSVQLPSSGTTISTSVDPIASPPVFFVFIAPPA